MKLPTIPIPKNVTRLIGKVMLKTKAAAPDICVIGGLILGGGALVMVGVKTWKNKDILETDANNVSVSKALVVAGTDDMEVATQRKNELVRSKKQFAKDICRTYWMPTTMAVGSAGLIWGGRILFRKEIAALGTAYALLFDSYKKYQERVAAMLGEDSANDIMHANQLELVEENGEKKMRATLDADPQKAKKATISRYARWFDEGDYDEDHQIWLWRNGYWTRDPLLNESFLRRQQCLANNRLVAYGFLFLNDAYKMLGMPPTKEGQIVGWTTDGKGDGYVDFGIFPTRDHPNVLAQNEPFLKSTSPNALLDFNVDGPILYKLEKAYGKDYAMKLLR